MSLRDELLRRSPASPLRRSPGLGSFRRRASTSSMRSRPQSWAGYSRPELSVESELWGTTLGNDGYELMHTLNSAKVRAVTFSHGGSIVATGGEDHKIRLWEPMTGKSMGVCIGHTGPVQSLAFSPGGSQLASGSLDKTVRVWAPRQARLLSILKGHRAVVSAVAISSSGRLIISGGRDNETRIWNARTFELIDIFEFGVAHAVTCVSVSPTESLLAEGSFDNTICLWEFGEGTRVYSKMSRIQEEERKRLASEIMQRSGNVALQKTKAEVRRRKLSFFNTKDDGSTTPEASSIEVPMKQNRPKATLVGHDGAVVAVCFSPDGRLLASGSHDAHVFFWDPEQGTFVSKFRTHCGQPVWSCVFSNDGTAIAVGTGEGHMELWDPANQQVLLNFKGHDSFIDTCAFSNDGLALATGSRDKTARLWKLLPMDQLLDLQEVLREQRARAKELALKRRAEMQDLKREQKEKKKQQKEAERRLRRAMRDAEKAQARAAAAQQAVITPSNGVIHHKIEVTIPDALLQRNQELSEEEKGRIKAIKELAAQRSRELEQERFNVRALKDATQDAAVEIDYRSRVQIQDEIDRNKRQAQGMSSFAPGSSTIDTEYLARLRARKAYLYRKLNRREAGTIDTYIGVESLHPEDVERQALWEEMLTHNSLRSAPQIMAANHIRR